MNSLEAHVEQSYYTRVALIGVLTVGIGAALMLLSQLSWAKTFDNSGVTRRDGKKLGWPGLKKIQYVHVRGVLNHVELIFKDGKANVFPLMLENGGDVMRFIGGLPGGKPPVKR